MHFFIYLVLFLIFGNAALRADEESAKAFADDRPNIIFFLTDDQRNDFLGCTGHPIIKTPNIDKLASGGRLFENAFVSTSICAASRATLLTGLYERTHRFTFGTPPVASLHTNQSYPALLRKDGYLTGFIGKWGIKVRKGAREAMFDSFVPLNRSPYFHKQKDGSLRHETQVAADKAIEFLSRAKKDAQPFCLSVSFNASHAEDGDKKNHFPYPKVVGSLYEGVKMPNPRLSDPAVFESQPEFLRKSMNRDRYFWRWDTEEKYQHNMRNYLRMISGIDHAIGRVIDGLDSLGMAKNTVIIYMADNGYYAASRGFAGKWSHYEESQRVPLIIFDPRAKKENRGKRDKSIALNVDVAPTIVALAGARLPESYQGRALSLALNGKAGKAAPSDFFCEHRMNNRSIPKWEGVRGQRYKYARYYEQEPPYEFLHDLESDPMELKNLVSDPNHKEKLDELRKRCALLSAKYDNQAKNDSRKVLRSVQFGLLDEGKKASGGEAIQEALALDPGSHEALIARADLNERAGKFGKALVDLDALVKALPGVDQLRQRRGVTRFFNGDMKGSIEDFDAYLKNNPAREPHHWQRGLAYYYAEEFAKGVDQFEIHQDVNSNDVENAVWHFLCVNKIKGFEEAKKSLIDIKGDGRVPMAQVQKLFAGELEPKDVLDAANAGDPAPDDLRNRLCYAHLYLGLYFEAKGDAKKSLVHIRKSAIDYAMPHYMGEVSRVHLQARTK
jgi:arylsulfatase A-like enzyme/lipoprotein NlpI